MSVKTTGTGQKGRLTAQQQRFVDEYLVDLNGTQAAIRAGYSAKTAQEQSSRLLSNVMVAAAVTAGQAARAKRVGITADRVLRELARVGFSDVTNYEFGGARGVVLSNGSPKTAMRAVSSIKQRTRTVEIGEATVVTQEVEFKLWDKVSALEKMGRHLGMFGDDKLPAVGLTIRVVRE
jgi:phage terminase small subunit